MITRNYIENGNLVYQKEVNSYHTIKDIQDARNAGHRGKSTTPDGELSYTIVDILTGEEHEGICEHSGMTSSFLAPATEKDIEIFLLDKEADVLNDLSKAKKTYAQVQKAMYESNKRIISKFKK